MTDTQPLYGDPLTTRRLTSADVRGASFAQTMPRGLNADQVGEFLRAVAAELDLLTVERNELIGQVDQLRQRPDPRQSPEHQARHILQAAQQIADRVIADGRAQAGSLVADGREQREEMLADGREQAERAIAGAIDEAGREAARIAAQAPLDAQREYTRFKALADSAHAGLAAWLDGLQAQVDAFGRQEGQGRRGGPLP